VARDEVRRETVLLIEPRADASARFTRELRSADRDVFAVATWQEAQVSGAQLDPAVVVASMEVPDAAGLRILDRVRERHAGVPIIALTAHPTVAASVAALRRGAADYVGLDEGSRLREAVARAIQETAQHRAMVRARPADREGFSQFLTRSPRMLDVFESIRAVAETDATVLVLGDTGTGKELVTRAIHERSRRKDKPFIAVNCGAFTETLLESELFGHERGSFTGATGKREGLFEMADGGTLFLDELGETSPSVQVNLLRVLENMTFRRVGGRDPVQVDVRILAATHVDLSKAVDERKFRQDLYYRLNVFPIRLPPLRERREDIPLLLRHFLDTFAEEYRLEPPGVSAEALRLICQYPWPGNVRQLRALCERWVIRCGGRRIEKDHLPSEFLDTTEATTSSATAGTIAFDPELPMRESVERVAAQIERAYLFRQLRKWHGHLEQTASASGITRRTLYTKMREYGLDQAEFKLRDRSSE
jgi:DNA-binding NtrC family response regulator